MKNMSFEEAVKKLDLIIQSFNNIDLPLEDAIKNYEEGLRLHKYCETLLLEASNKFEKINDNL